MANQKNITIDITKIPNTKCYCGADIYIKVSNLKYISPILCGDPKGATVDVTFWACAFCGQLYPTALTAGQIANIYQALPPERKTLIDNLKEKSKDGPFQIFGAGFYAPPVQK